MCDTNDAMYEEGFANGEPSDDLFDTNNYCPPLSPLPSLSDDSYMQLAFSENPGQLDMQNSVHNNEDQKHITWMLNKLERSNFVQSEHIRWLTKRNNQLLNELKTFKSEFKEELRQLQSQQMDNKQRFQVKYINIGHILTGMDKLQINSTEMIRDVKIPCLPSSVFKLKFRVIFHVGNTVVGYTIAGCTNTHNHLYATVNICQTGHEQERGATATFHQIHYNVYANNFIYDVEIPWDGNSFQRVHVQIKNAICSGWYPITPNNHINNNFIQIQLIGAEMISH